MKNKKYVFFILFLGIFLILITGCSNYDEFSNVMIIDGIGIDKNDNKYIVSFNTYLENDKYKVINLEVNNLDDAFNKIYLKTNKKIYLSHLKILLLSSNLNNNDITDIINIFNNRDDLRGSFLVSLIDNYDNNIFENESLFLVNLINNNYYESGDVYPTTYNDIIYDYLNLDISYLPVINNNNLSINGVHSIFSEYRFYSLDESKYLNLIMNNLDSFNLEIDNEEVSIKKTKVFYKVDRNNIDIHINILYSGIEKNKLSKFLNKEITSLLERDINTNYFLDLIKKYNYSYYKEHDSIKINFNLFISLEKEDISNIKGDELIEKDY
ncbi:MAG: hypothetical protein IJN90_03815 [Bacilli bacterium]|nr:hypothetical protein [Bacilli bacterium]